jgi:AcrR family transcriptional regulator
VQRTDILQAAAQIFREKGYHATSMRDIADAVQLQKASLYHHVNSKQEILLSVLDLALDLLIEDLEVVAHSDKPPEVKLREAIGVYVGRLAENSDLAAVLLLEHRNLESELHADHIGRRDRFEYLWRGLIQEGIDKGIYREADVPITTFALLGVQNWMITWYRPHGRCNAEQIADQFAELFIRGLLIDEGELG